MSIETFSIEVYFGGDAENCNEAQLLTEVKNSGAFTRNCLDVGRLGDSIRIRFDAPLSNGEKESLLAVVQSHIPAAERKIAQCYVEHGSSLVKHDINGIPHTFLGSQPDEIYISKGSQRHYATLKEAVQANFHVNAIYVLYPGEYWEDNPITLPNGSIIRGASTPWNTIIKAKNPDANLLNYGTGCGIINVSLVGSTGASGVYFDGTQSGGKGSFSTVMQCFVLNCKTAIEIDGKNLPSPGVVDVLYVDRVIIRSITQICEKGLSIVNGGQAIVSHTRVIGVPPSQQIPNGLPFLYGFYCTGAKTNISLTSIYSMFCQVGLFVNDAANVDASLNKIRYNAIGIQIGNTGTTTSVTGIVVDVDYSSQYDIDIQATEAKLDFTSAVIDDTKIRNPNRVKINLSYNSRKFGRYGHTMIGEVAFGNSREPTKVAIGEGQYADSGIVVFANSNLEVGTWIDNSNGASTFDAPAFNMFSGTTAGNTLYVGSDAYIPGFKAEIISKVQVDLERSATKWEYWNGNNWIEFAVMQTYADYPCYTFMKSFISEDKKFHLRFGLKNDGSMAKKTLNGKNKYWVRLRLLQDIPNVPVSEYLKVHLNHMLINSDGFPEYFGMARPVNGLLSNMEMFFAPDDTASQTFYLSSGIALPVKRNVYRAGEISNRGARALLKTDLDISFPIRIEVAFSGSIVAPGAMVSWSLHYTKTVEGDDICLEDNYAPSVHPNQKTITQVVPISGGKDNRLVFRLPVDDIDVNPINGKTVILWLGLERDARPQNNADTYAGDVSVVLVKTSYVSWNNGSHISGF